MDKKKRFYKSTADKKICGVCAGIAEYFEIDPTIVRVIFAVLSLCTTVFPGLAIYVILAIVLPKDVDVLDSYVHDADDDKKE